MKNIPNILTMLRILIIPVCVLTMLMEKHTGCYRVSAWLFGFACLTDFLDGVLARLLDASSNFGSLFDPIADKLLVASVMMIMVKDGTADLLPSIAILCREILVSGLREFLAKVRVSLPVSSLSKLKTGLQMVAIFILMFGQEPSEWEYWQLSGRITLWVAAALTLFTGYAYLKASYKFFLDHKVSKVNG
jgi:CDP-diacylglycerol--glycerol-3-phosphate 3-phosphatidyltransferase